MRTQRLLYAIRIVLLFGTLFFVCRPVLYAAKPNIIVILADDFGYECLTANGGESYQTPNLDRLAATGMRFEHCHVQPLCTPTRVQLMTGRFNVRNYVNFGTLPRSETTFANLLQTAGYSTAVCGKWQLGRELDSPKHFGFNESCLWQHTRRPPRYANPGLEYNGEEKNFDHGEYGPKLLNDFAVDFVTRHRDKPFFLYYPMTLTHDPFQPTPESHDWDPKAIGEGVNNNVIHFADMTKYMDKLIGQLDSKLSELGIRDNTLLLFIGDNGTLGKVTSRFQRTDYRGGKGTTTQRGTHVPLIASWPQVVKTGSVNQDLISSVDILPTICEAAGVIVPVNSDGVSFGGQLRGEKGTPREWLYSWYSPRQQADLTVKEFSHNRRYKLYRTGEFFDLAVDPFEQHSLAKSSLTGDAEKAAGELQKVLDRFADARSPELDLAFEKASARNAKQ